MLPQTQLTCHAQICTTVTEPSRDWTAPEVAERPPRSAAPALYVPLYQRQQVYCGQLIRLVVSFRLRVELVEVSLMALVRGIALASGVDCSVVELVEMQCLGWEVVEVVVYIVRALA